MPITLILANALGERLAGLDAAERGRLGFSISVESTAPVPRKRTTRLGAGRRSATTRLDRRLFGVDPADGLEGLGGGPEGGRGPLSIDPGPAWDPEGLTLPEVNLRLDAAEGSVRFGYRNIGPNDVITVTQLDPRAYLAAIAHTTPRTTCRARCPDGSENHPCVECTVDGIVVRVCC